MDYSDDDKGNDGRHAMKTVFSPLHAGHAGNTELTAGAIVPAFEKPSRAEIVRARVESEKLGPILLPVEPVGELLGVDPRTVGRYRTWAEKDGYLREVARADERVDQRGGIDAAHVADKLAVDIAATLADHLGHDALDALPEEPDELFAGYDWFRTYLEIEDRFWRHAERTPLVARRAAAAVAQPLVQKVLKKRLASELVRRLGRNESLFWGGAIVFDETMKRRVLTPEAKVSY